MRRPHRVFCRWAGRSTAWPGAQTLTRSGPLGFVTAVVDTVPAAGVACWCAGRCTLAEGGRATAGTRACRACRGNRINDSRDEAQRTRTGQGLRARPRSAAPGPPADDPMRPPHPADDLGVLPDQGIKIVVADHA